MSVPGLTALNRASIGQSGESQVAQAEPAEDECGALLVGATGGNGPLYQAGEVTSDERRLHHGPGRGTLLLEIIDPMRSKAFIPSTNHGRARSVMVTKVPGLSQRGSRNGVSSGVSVMEVTTTSAPVTASRALALAMARSPITSAVLQSSSRLGAPRPKARISRSGNMAENSRKWLRACTPHPMNAATDESARASRFAATPLRPAVRTAVTQLPSTTARGRPVSLSSR